MHGFLKSFLYLCMCVLCFCKPRTGGGLADPVTPNTCNALQSMLHVPGCMENVLNTCTEAEVQAVIQSGGVVLDCSEEAQKERGVWGLVDCQQVSDKCQSRIAQWVQDNTNAFEDRITCLGQPGFYKPSGSECKPLLSSYSHCLEGVCACKPPFGGPNCDTLVVTQETQFPKKQNNYWFMANPSTFTEAWKTSSYANSSAWKYWHVERPGASGSGVVQYTVPVGTSGVSDVKSVVLRDAVVLSAGYLNSKNERAFDLPTNVDGENAFFDVSGVFTHPSLGSKEVLFFHYGLKVGKRIEKRVGVTQDKDGKWYWKKDITASDQTEGWTLVSLKIRVQYMDFRSDAFNPTGIRQDIGSLNYNKEDQLVAVGECEKNCLEEACYEACRNALKESQQASFASLKASTLAQFQILVDPSKNIACSDSGNGALIGYKKCMVADENHLCRSDVSSVVTCCGDAHIQLPESCDQPHNCSATCQTLFNIQPFSNTVVENGPEALLSFAPVKRPVSPVQVNFSVSPAEQGNVASSLSFTTNAVQNARITAVWDRIDDGDVVFDVSARIASSDPYYNGILLGTWSYTASDIDTASVMLSAFGNTTSEAGQKVPMNIVLGSKPRNDVVVALTTHNTNEVFFQPPSVAFNGSNWNVAQSVNAVGKDDNILDGNVVYSVSSVGASSDAVYNGLVSDVLSFTNQDNDIAEISISDPTPGSIVVEGSLTPVVVSVQLASAPLNAVVFNVLPSLPFVSVSPSVVSFNGVDWNQAKTISISASDDAFARTSPQSLSLAFVVNTTLTTDAGYRPLSNTVKGSLSYQDNDTAGLQVQSCSPSTRKTAENGASVECQAVLSSEPLTPVEISLSSDLTSEGVVSPSSLSYPRANTVWSAPYVFTVTGVDDDVVDAVGNTPFNVVARVQTGDGSSYLSNNVLMSLGFTNTDLDTASFVFEPNTDFISTEGVQNILRVSLSSKPTANVVVSKPFANIPTTEVTLASASNLIWTPADWNVPQNIVVNGVLDNVTDADVGYRILTNSVSSTDPLFNNITSLFVKKALNRNIDAVGFVVQGTLSTHNALSFIDIYDQGHVALYDNAPGYITAARSLDQKLYVSLLSRPMGNVVVNIGSSNTSLGVISSTTTVAASPVFFTPSNWNVGQSFVVNGVASSGLEDASYTVSLQVQSNAPGAYNGVSRVLGFEHLNKNGPQWTSVSISSRHSCGLDVKNRAWCWGRNDSKRLGIDLNQTGNEGFPRRVYLNSTQDDPAAQGIGRSHSWWMLKAGFEHSCGIVQNGALYCWGKGSNGRLGYGSSSIFSFPMPGKEMINAAVAWQDVAPSLQHTCAIDAGGKLYCWGSNTYISGLGNSPLQMGTRTNWASLSVGLSQHTCAIDTAQQLYCWGSNVDKTVANTADDKISFANAVQIPGDWKKVVTGSNVESDATVAPTVQNTCGVSINNGLYCWGDALLAKTSRAFSSSDNPMVSNVVDVAIGVSGTRGLGIALGTNQKLYTWGNTGVSGNYLARVVSTATPANTPALVTYAPLNGLLFQSISAGNYHMCAVTLNGVMYCWGLDSDGRLGHVDVVSNGVKPPNEVVRNN
jgi:alpha-tubulin suppressor-like RCC1 family protein